MENNSTNDISLNLSIDDTAASHLRTAATWAKIIAIGGFIGIVLGVIRQIKLLTRTGFVPGAEGIGQGFSLLFAVIFYIIAIIIYLYLLRFANLTKAGITTLEQGLFNGGIDNLRSFFKLLGIIMIIALAICFLGFLAVLAGAAMKK